MPSVTWEPSSPPVKKGHSSPPFSAYVFCGQTAGWIKIPLGMEIGIGPGHVVLDGDPHLAQRGTAPNPLNFPPMSVVANGWIKD